MENQIREQMENAFFDLIDKDSLHGKTDHIKILRDEIIVKLQSFVPNRKDIHKKIEDDLCGEIDWGFQEKLLDWIMKFQAPVYDSFIQKWRQSLPESLSTFMRKYYSHLEIVNKELYEYRLKKVEGKNGIPQNMKSGR